MVTHNFERLKSLITWHSLQNGHIIYHRTESKTYHRLDCIYKNCSFKFTARLDTSPLFGSKFPLYFVERYVEHTCEPLEDVPWDFPKDDKDLLDDNSPYVNNARLLSALMPHRFIDNISQFMATIPDGRYLTNDDAIQLLGEYRNYMKIHPKYTRSSKITPKFLQSTLHNLGAENHLTLKNIFVAALLIKLFSPQSTVSITYGDDPADPQLSVTVLSHQTNGSNAMEHTGDRDVGNSTVTENEVEDTTNDGDDGDDEDEKNIVFVENVGPGNIPMDMEMTKREIGVFALHQDHKEQLAIDEATLAKKRTTFIPIGQLLFNFQSPSSRNNNKLPSRRGLSNYINNKTVTPSSDEPELYIKQIERIKNIENCKRLKERFDQKVMKGTTDFYISTESIGTIWDAYSKYCKNIDDTKTSSSSSLPQPSSSSSLSSSLDSSFGATVESSPSNLYETEPEVRTYLEDLSSHPLLHFKKTYCQRTGCKLRPGELHCGNTLHTFFTGNEKIDDNLYFPFSSLVHNLEKWFSPESGTKNMSPKSFFLSSSSMKKMLKIVDPVISIDVTFFKGEELVGPFVLYLAVAQSPSSYSDYILGVG